MKCPYNLYGTCMNFAKSYYGSSCSNCNIIKRKPATNSKDVKIKAWAYGDGIKVFGAQVHKGDCYYPSVPCTILISAKDYARLKGGKK
jgi:hypothetical protein